MTQPTNHPPDWMVVSLKEHILSQLALHQAQHDAEGKALDVASREMSRRLDGMNEFREQLRDQATTFVPREVHELLELRIRSLEQRLAVIGGATITVATIISVALKFL